MLNRSAVGLSTSIITRGCALVSLLLLSSCFSAEEPPGPSTRVDPNLPAEAGTADGRTPSAACMGRVAGEKFCRDAELVTCTEQGIEVVSQACSGATPVCLASACVSCAPGAQRCEGTTAYRCDQAGFWQPSAVCEFTCVDGACGGLCTPGERRCDGGAPMACGADGKWQRGAECPFVCSEGACSGSCRPGDKDCSGQQPRTCDAQGLWVMSPACEFVCSKGECKGACEPGETQCNGKEIQTCGASGVWETTSTCPFVCSQGSCAGVCQPNDKRCSDKTPETCAADGSWKQGSSCTYVCSDGECGGSCVPGAVSCSGQLPMRCDADGVPQPAGSACPFLCTDGSCTGACVPGTRRCAGTQPELCGPLGQWQVDGAPCPNVCAGAGTCSGSCVPGTSRCGSNAHTELCSAGGEWTAGSTCPGAAPSCVATAQGLAHTTYVGSCNDGSCGAPAVAASRLCATPGNSCADGLLTTFTATCDDATGCGSNSMTSGCPTQPSQCDGNLGWQSYRASCASATSCGSPQANPRVACGAQPLAAPYCSGAAVVTEVATCEDATGCGKSSVTSPCPASGASYQCGRDAFGQPVEVPRVPGCSNGACTMVADTSNGTVCPTKASCESVCVLELRGRCVRWGERAVTGSPYCNDNTGRCSTQDSTKNCWGSVCLNSYTVRANTGCSAGACTTTDTRCASNQACVYDPDTGEAECLDVIE